MPPSTAISRSRGPGSQRPGAATPRLVQHQGRTFLQPTVVFCDPSGHALANREFLFPYCSVLEMPQAEMLGQDRPVAGGQRGHRRSAWRRELLASPLIHRLNLGAMPTSHVHWDQPHEGNLFDVLYRRRAVQTVA
jgi:hypothetical protein